MISYTETKICGYDEYLKYVTAKDGGIIQLSQGGDNEDPIAENKKVNLRNILAFIRENKDLRKESIEIPWPSWF